MTCTSSPEQAQSRYSRLLRRLKHNRHADDPLFRPIDADDFRVNGDKPATTGPHTARIDPHHAATAGECEADRPSRQSPSTIRSRTCGGRSRAFSTSNHRRGHIKPFGSGDPIPRAATNGMAESRAFRNRLSTPCRCICRSIRCRQRSCLTARAFEGTIFPMPCAGSPGPWRPGDHCRSGFPSDAARAGGQGGLSTRVRPVPWQRRNPPVAVDTHRFRDSGCDCALPADTDRVSAAGRFGFRAMFPQMMKNARTGSPEALPSGKRYDHRFWPRATHRQRRGLRLFRARRSCAASPGRRRTFTTTAGQPRRCSTTTTPFPVRDCEQPHRADPDHGRRSHQSAAGTRRASGAPGLPPETEVITSEA